MSSRPIISMSAIPRSSDRGFSSSARSLTTPSIFSTRTEFSLTLTVELLLATMPAILIMKKIPMMTKRITIPQIVARVYLKNCLILMLIVYGFIIYSLCLTGKGTTFFLSSYIFYDIFGKKMFLVWKLMISYAFGLSYTSISWSFFIRTMIFCNGLRKTWELRTHLPSRIYVLSHGADCDRLHFN